MIDAIVTGASGFIGARLVAKLLEKGKKIVALSSCNGEVSDSDTWSNLPSARTVFHLAGRTFVPDSWKDSASFFQTNIIGTEQALAYCKRNGAGLVLASAYVYGPQKKLPISENQFPRPNNPYALSKLMAENLVEFYNKYHQVSATILRLFNVYGPSQGSSFLIPHIIQQVLDGKIIKVDDLSPRRDYIYIDDVIDAFILALETPVDLCTLNIGSGMSISVAEVIDIIQQEARTMLPVNSSKIIRNNEIFDVQADISSAKKILGWNPCFTFQQGIREIFREVIRSKNSEN